MTRFALYLGGPVHPTQRLRAQIAGRTCIAADSGVRHAETFNSQITLWVGDFDSSTELDQQTHAEVPKQQHSTDKALTDGALAIDAALEMGATDLLLVGGIGGRHDHTHAVFTQAMRLARSGLEAVVTNGKEEGVPLSDQFRTFDYPPGTVFSVLAFSDLAGLTLQGAQWPLDAIEMAFGDTLTVSNIVSSRLTACVGQGDAMLLAQLSAP